MRVPRSLSVVVVVVVGAALVAAACAPPTIGNLKPVAVASASTASGPAPLEVQFSAAGSSDADGTIASFSWDFGDGSVPSTTSDVTHVYTEPGAYTAALTVRDDDGAEATATVQIEVASVNQSPTAVISASTTTGRAPLSLQFTGSGSVDVDGVLTSHSWDFGDGTSSDQADTTHVFAEPGTYVVTLTVTDDDGATSMASTTVTAMPNLAPTAVATADPTSGPVPLTVAFTGSGSSDPDGSVASYSWDFGDGTSSTEVDPTHVYATEGTYVATLTVTDDNGGTDTASVQVGSSSAPENEAPSAVGAASPEVGVAPLVVDFTGSSSSDPDGQVASYSWDFGDGATSSEADPAHTYTTPGSYTATLTVTDAPGLTDTASVAIEVTSNQAPIAVLNATPQSGPRPLTVGFDASGSTDPEGGDLSYAWSFGDGSTGTGVAPEHEYAAGHYTATLVVADGAGAASDPVSIDIEVYIDDDGDGFWSPTDCDDGDADVHPGASDTLDAQSADGFEDSNCDGVDGVVSETVFVRAPGGGDGPGCGDLAAPCATVGAGIEAALASGRATVQVAAGSYPGFSVDGGSALTVRGGYQPSFDGRAAAPTTVVGAGVGAHFDGTRSTTLFDLEVDGGSGAESTGMLVENSGQITLSRVRVDSGEAVGAGSSTYGVRVLTRSGISIRNSSVVARPGRAGTDGAGGATGIAGSAGLGGNPPFGAPPLVGGSGGLGAPTCTGQDPRWGGKGGDGSNGITQTAPGGSGHNGCGGALGGRGQLLPVGGNWCAAPAVGGAQGRSGQTGGTPGIGSAAVSLSARLGATYMRSQGANGGVGANGQGGAGGGGGIGGGGGGAGGLGGSGGAGGIGGSDGGGSFGVYVFGASVGIISSEVTASAGGAGGLGGSGGAGGAGGAGGRGGPGSQPPYALGCNGGAGGGGAGAGAGGGGGGGGAAGPSVALVVQDFVNIQMGSASLRRSDEVAHGGTGGSSGAGGQPGARGLGSNGAGNGGFGAVGFPGAAGAAGSDSLNARWVRNGVVVDP